MAIDYNQIATQGIANLQTAINSLNALKRQPGADFSAIVAQIENLEEQQTNLRIVALKAFEEDPANIAAIAALSAAADNLKAEAGNIQSVASALATAAKVVGYATDLANALAAFAV